jgi:hypothetical protein
MQFQAIDTYAAKAGDDPDYACAAHACFLMSQGAGIADRSMSGTTDALTALHARCHGTGSAHAIATAAGAAYAFIVSSVSRATDAGIVPMSGTAHAQAISVPRTSDTDIVTAAASTANSR